MYEITKKFLTGVLKDMTVVEKTTVKFTKGKKIKSCTGSEYIVLDVVKIK